MTEQAEQTRHPSKADETHTPEFIRHSIDNALRCSNGVTSLADRVLEKLVATAELQATQLARRSVELAQARSASTVELRDVDDADRELNNHELASRLSNWLLTVGGLLCGIAVALVGVVLSLPDLRHSMPWWLWVAIAAPATVGTLLLIFTFPRKKKTGH